MKKIVALVLSLVMVLGLATTAFGATVTYDVYDNEGEIDAYQQGIEYTVKDAKYNAKTYSGNVEYVKVGSWGANFVECDKADADYYLTLHGEDDAVMYLKQVKNVNYRMGAEFTNVGTACGQLNVSAKYDYYLTKEADGTETYYQGVKDTEGELALLVAGELVQVKVVGNTDSLIGHDWEIAEINAKHEVVALECEECGVVAKTYDSKLAAPKGAWKDDTYGWIAIVAADAPAADAETDKVESAQTFDAGIAMYVGMSVMAAAGSAVVLKKKD